MLLRISLLIAGLCLVDTSYAGPLFEAADRGDYSAAQRLIEDGVPVDERGRDEATPLIAAALSGATDIVKLLVAANADIMARNRGGYTALHAAAYQGHLDIVQFLVDSGAALEDRENLAGQTPLFLAAEEGRLEVVTDLLARGADATVVDATGFNMLTQTWAKKHIEIVRLLKEHGATCQSAEVLGSEEYYLKCVSAGE